MGGIVSNENQQSSQTGQSDIQGNQSNSQIQQRRKLAQPANNNLDLKNCNQDNEMRQQVQPQLQLQREQKIQIQQIEEFRQTQDDVYFEFQRKCVINGHKQAQILEYCLNNQCKESNRFICELCKKNGLHQQDLNFKKSDIITQYQISDRIKENYNNQVKIHNQCTKIVLDILKKFKGQVETLYQHIANLTNLANFNESRQSLLFLQQILKEQINIGQVANDQLFKIVTEEPGTYVFKQFSSIIDNFKLIQTDIEQLRKTSEKIPQLQENIWRILKEEQKEQTEQQKADPKQQEQDKLTDEILSQTLFRIVQEESKEALENLKTYFQENKNVKREGEIRITLGYTYYKEKDYVNSRIQYQEALKIQNQKYFYKIYYYIGKCQFKQYELDQSFIKCEDILKNFQQTLILRPSFSRAYIQIAKIYLKLYNTEEAINILMEGLELDNKNRKILSFLARINLDRLQYKEALKYYDICLALSRNYVASFFGKCISLISKIKDYNFFKAMFKYKQYERVIDFIDRIIQYNNYVPEAYIIKCDCLHRLNQDEKAIEILNNQPIRLKGDIRFQLSLGIYCIQQDIYNYCKIQNIFD